MIHRITNYTRKRLQHYVLDSEIARCIFLLIINSCCINVFCEYMYNDVDRCEYVCREFGELRAAREAMAERYPLSGELWLAYLEDEVRMASSEEERQAVVALFERAVNDYASVEVWLAYVAFGGARIGRASDDEERERRVAAARAVVQRALDELGSHVAAGARLWLAALRFEMALTPLDAARVRSLARQRAAHPLAADDDVHRLYLEWEAARADADDAADATAAAEAVALVQAQVLVGRCALAAAANASPALLAGDIRTSLTDNNRMRTISWKS
jgi:hypothetical protein